MVLATVCDPVFLPLHSLSLPSGRGRRVKGGKGAVQEAAALTVALCGSDEALGTRGTLRPTLPLLLVLLCRPLPSAPPRVLPTGASPGFSWSRGGSLDTHPLIIPVDVLVQYQSRGGTCCHGNQERRPGSSPSAPRACLFLFSQPPQTAAPTSACLSVSLRGSLACTTVPECVAHASAAPRPSPHPLAPPDPLCLFSPQLLTLPATGAPHSRSH